MEKKAQEGKAAEAQIAVLKSAEQNKGGPESKEDVEMEVDGSKSTIGTEAVGKGILKRQSPNDAKGGKSKKSRNNRVNPFPLLGHRKNN